MKLKDKKIIVSNEIEFWNKWIKFMGIHLPDVPVENLPNKPLADLERFIYATALSMNQEEPFMGQAMYKLIEDTGQTKETFSSYKYNLKKKGWLLSKGQLTPAIVPIRKAVKLEISNGIKPNIALIYTICACD
jgi:hypothetical protein